MINHSGRAQFGSFMFLRLASCYTTYLYDLFVLPFIHARSLPVCPACRWSWSRIKPVAIRYFSGLVETDGANEASCYRLRSPFRRSDTSHSGPAELSIASANAAYAILGPGGCLKSPWYDYGYGQPLNSLHSTRDPAIHEYRRRIWDHGFSSKGKAGALKPPTAPFAHSQIP
jgi:hypothetical protein